MAFQSVAGAVAVGTCLVCSSPGLGQSSGQSSDRLLQAFDGMVFSQIDSYVKGDHTNDSGQITWGPAYLLDALAEMLEATRSPRYAAAFTRLADWVIASSDDRIGRQDQIRGRVVTGWSTRSATCPQFHAWAVSTGMIVAPLAHFSDVVGHEPKLAGGWGGTADRYLQFARQAVDVQEDAYRPGPAVDEGYLVHLFNGRPQPLNMQNALARAWVWIDHAGGTSHYRPHTERLARFLKNRLRTTENGAYVWPYSSVLLGPSSEYEDISHAACNFDFMVLCYEQGIVFDGQDLQRLKKTLNTVLGDGNRVANNVGATDGDGRFPHAVLKWGRIARHDRTARQRLFEFWQVNQQRQAITEPLGIAFLVRAFAQDVRRPASSSQP
jgi:hypothetical protein